jgi:hypothetical protein
VLRRTGFFDAKPVERQNDVEPRDLPMVGLVVHAGEQGGKLKNLLETRSKRTNSLHNIK